MTDQGIEVGGSCVGGSRRQDTNRRWGRERERRQGEEAEEKKTIDRWRHCPEQGKLSEGIRTMLCL